MKFRNKKINFYLVARDFMRENNDSNYQNTINGRRISQFSILHTRVFDRNMVGLCTGEFYGIDTIKFNRKRIKIRKRRITW